MIKNFIIRIFTIIVIISISIFLSACISLQDNDFENTRKKFQSGDIELFYNLSDIPKEYYLKPSFYTSYNRYIGVKEQKGTYGYGAQPSKVGYNVTKFKENQHLDIYTFVYSSYDVGTYQGIGLDLISPNDELFDTYTDPSDILLYPIILGDPKKQSNWAYRIQMRVISKKDIPAGEYTFRLITREPSAERQEEFYNTVQDMNGRYVNVGPIRPADFFDFVLYAYD